jgi:hypothetical protein
MELKFAPMELAPPEPQPTNTLPLMCLCGNGGLGSSVMRSEGTGDVADHHRSPTRAPSSNTRGKRSHHHLSPPFPHLHEGERGLWAEVRAEQAHAPTSMLPTGQTLSTMLAMSVHLNNFSQQNRLSLPLPQILRFVLHK